MSAVQLDELKAMARVDFNDDDQLLQSFLNAAEGYVLEVGVAIATPAQAAVKHAILMLASHWYENREAVAGGDIRKVPLGFEMLIAPYREVNL